MVVPVYHTDLAKMVPDVGIDGKVYIQRALKLTNVDSDLKLLASVPKFWKHDQQTYTICVLVNNCLQNTGQASHM